MPDPVLFVHALFAVAVVVRAAEFEEEDDVLVLMASNFDDAVSGMYEVFTSTNATEDYAAVNKVVLYKELDEDKVIYHGELGKGAMGEFFKAYRLPLVIASTQEKAP
ncbi:hypothetical protein PF006_g32723 [Phytophthora fragariae]|uniref:Uncharacterized protein n=2 Tax=Phytophthora fragariae TaxID=53985 RepID=A0A6A3PKF3_9STRA|nr:hypothetical protein PF003_g23608 [Phytophthora fragariae]KAE9056291.1 hypothetical protein PF006_g32723 [Phytophthora fragariae]